MQAEHERLLREGWRLCADGCYRKDGQEKAFCSLCAAVESPGFYTGCMVKDGHAPEWQCDNGKLTRKSFSDPCPDCGTQLECASGGGVKCPACSYWFCF